MKLERVSAENVVLTRHIRPWLTLLARAGDQTCTAFSVPARKQLNQPVWWQIIIRLVENCLLENFQGSRINHHLNKQKEVLVQMPPPALLHWQYDQCRSFRRHNTITNSLKLPSKWIFTPDFSMNNLGRSVFIQPVSYDQFKANIKVP